MAKVRNNKMNYKAINVTFADDPHLSLAAKGLMVYINSKDDGWEIKKEDLVKNASTDGQTKVETALLDLMESGYIYYYPERDVEGKISDWVYEVYGSPDENPYLEIAIVKAKDMKKKRKERNKKKNSKRISMQQETDYPKVVELEVDNPKMDNPKVEKSPETDNPLLDENLQKLGENGQVLDNPLLDNPSIYIDDKDKDDIDDKKDDDNPIQLSFDLVQEFIYENQIEDEEVIEELIKRCDKYEASTIGYVEKTYKTCVGIVEKRRKSKSIPKPKQAKNGQNKKNKQHKDQLPKSLNPEWKKKAAEQKGKVTDEAMKALEERLKKYKREQEA